MALEYRLDISAEIRAAARRILSEAESYGFTREVEEAIDSLETRMMTDPSRFGDPAYRLPFDNGMVYRDMQDVVCVYYTIDEEERAVRVRAIRRASFLGE